MALGKLVNAKMSARAASRCSATAGEFVDQGLEDSVELGLHGIGVGLVIDRVQQRFHPAPGVLRCGRHQVGRVMGAAALPRGAGERGADRLDQAAVRVGGHQPDAGEAAGGQVAEERQPAGASSAEVTCRPRISR
jgi:hypothetical protein